MRRAAPALSLSILLLALGAGAAEARTYPKEVRSAYMSSCKASAKGSGATSAQASRYCSATLRCLERKLTFKEFKSLDWRTAQGRLTAKQKRVMRTCVAEGQRAL